MPFATWKIMLRRADQAGYHYIATQQRGRARVEGEQIDHVVEGRTVKWTIAEILKDHSTRDGKGVFTVRVDEAKAIFE